MTFGVRLAYLRQQAGWSQGELASRARVSQGYLSQLEKGDVKNPGASIVERLAAAFGCDARGITRGRAQALRRAS